MLATTPPLRTALLACAAAVTLGVSACDHDVASGAAPDGGRRLAPPDLAGPIQCPDGEHPTGDGTGCVEDVTPCGPEFPCPFGLRCVDGECRDLRDPCGVDTECPVGERCVRGLCEPDCPDDARCRADADCGARAQCVACWCVSVATCARPTPDLAGPVWKVTQDLYIDDALGSLGKTFNSLMERLRDGVLGCPAGSDPGCPLFKLVADALPEWARIIVVVVGDFADVIDNDSIRVASEMTFTPS